MTTATTGPIEGYVKVAPTVTIDGDAAVIDGNGVYYRQLNEAVREAFAGGVKTVRLRNINGQRYIGNGITGSDLRIEVEGVPGGDLAMFMNGPTVVVDANAQDGVGEHDERGDRASSTATRATCSGTGCAEAVSSCAATSATASAST